MDILDKIVVHKRKEVEAQKKVVSIDELQQKQHYNRTCYSLKESISRNNGVIAEYKRQSPSKGVINNTSTVQEVVKGYQNAGVSAVSVLTDSHFFGGNLEDLLEARNYLKIPLLRKDFVISEYQIYEAKAYGADVILLIAAILTKKEIENFANLTNSLGMEVLFEVHNELELEKWVEGIHNVGVNNRNLKTFEVDLSHSRNILPNLKKSLTKISESGISDPNTINSLREIGVEGFLIGENFMKTNNPAQTCIEFCKQLN